MSTPRPAERLKGMFDIHHPFFQQIQPKESLMKKVLIVLFALAVVSPVLAQDTPPEGPPPGVVAAHNQVVRFLELTEDQVTAWDEMILIHRDAEQPIREEMRILEGELKDLIDAGDADPTAVGEIVIEIAGLRASLGEIQMTYHEDFTALLDEDQMGRLGFIARADRVQPIIPAFKLFELIPRH
jgi:Spy/CpxP family protein refolding chaperone